MKRLIGAVMVVAVLVSVAPALAGDSFHALSRLPAGLTPLDDAQLAAVEGGQVAVCIVCLNTAVVVPIQANVQIAAVVFSEEVNVEQLGIASVEVEVSQGNN
jgi:hypothetical protein